MNRYYIQDTRQVVGNCMLLWKIDGKGYTTNLDEAWLVDEGWSERDTDVLWPEEILREIARPRVDVQNLPERSQLKFIQRREKSSEKDSVVK